MADDKIVGKRWVAAEYGTPESLKLEEFNVPAPRDGEVVLRVLATTATYTDLLVLRGNYMPRFPPPVTPGYDGCAVVHAVGQGVSGLKVGDAVITMPQHGCFSTHVVLPEKLCVPVELPAGVSPEEAACVALTGITAYQQLHRHAKKQIEKPDASVLVHSAAGGTGAMLVEVAKAAGVKTIFGTCGAHNLDTVRAHGATAFDYNTDWDAQLREASGGAGVDVVHDALVLGGNLEKGLRLLKPGGVYIAYGFTNMGKPGMFDFMSAATALTRISLQHFVFSWFDKKDAVFTNVANDRDARPGEYAEDCRTLVAMLGDGRLRPVIGKTWAFEEADEALKSIAKNQHVGKQVVKVAL